MNICFRLLLAPLYAQHKLLVKALGMFQEQRLTVDTKKLLSNFASITEAAFPNVLRSDVKSTFIEEGN